MADRLSLDQGNTGVRTPSEPRSLGRWAPTEGHPLGTELARVLLPANESGGQVCTTPYLYR